MALTIGATTYDAYGPDQTNQILTTGGKAEDRDAIRGYATITLDGVTTTATINFIDGTKTLSFTPVAVMATVAGGTETTALVIGVNTVTNTGFGITLSGAGTNTHTIVVAFIAFKNKTSDVPAKFFVEPYLSHGE